MRRSRSSRRRGRAGFWGLAGLWLALTAAAGCAFSDGQPWGEVDAEVQATFEVPTDRLVGGQLRTSRGFGVDLTALEVTFDALEVTQAAEGASLAFDPANPPPGYSLCHGGHCHADSGGLVSYEEIAVELATGGGGGGASLTLPLGGAELLAGPATVEVAACDGGCLLGYGRLAGARLIVDEVRLAGRVFDQRPQGARLPEGGVAFVATVPLEVSFTAPLAGAADEVTPVVVDLDGGFRLTERLFDGVEWQDVLPAAVGEDEVVDLKGSEAFVEAVRAAIEEHSVWVVAATRRDRH